MSTPTQAGAMLAVFAVVASAQVAWHQRITPTGPGPRSYHAMVFDDARQRTVLFGGFIGGTVTLNDTWEWDGTTWTLRPTVHAPGPRWLYRLAYDRGRGRTVLFGGQLPQ